jgi:flagellar biosynthesis protein FliR
MTDILIADFVTGLLVFMRVTAIIVVAPVFSQANFPTFT